LSRDTNTIKIKRGCVFILVVFLKKDKNYFLKKKQINFIFLPLFVSPIKLRFRFLYNETKTTSFSFQKTVLISLLRVFLTKRSCLQLPPVFTSCTIWHEKDLLVWGTKSTVIKCLQLLSSCSKKLEEEWQLQDSFQNNVWWWSDG
jgi:hypothetical protein